MSIYRQSREISRYFLAPQENWRFGENMLRNIKGLILCVSLETPDVLIALIQVMRLYTEMETH